MTYICQTQLIEIGGKNNAQILRLISGYIKRRIIRQTILDCNMSASPLFKICYFTSSECVHTWIDHWWKYWKWVEEFELTQLYYTVTTFSPICTYTRYIHFPNALKYKYITQNLVHLVCHLKTGLYRPFIYYITGWWQD